MRVAAEEAHHHSLLVAHLLSLGQACGDFDAHDGLWVMTFKTRHDFVARMALVPRTREARGLDATPPIQAKLRRAGDLRAVEILDVILRDEIGHVAVGNRWSAWACARAGLDPIAHHPLLVRQYAAPPLRVPLNRPARLAVGFSPAEVDAQQAQVEAAVPGPLVPLGVLDRRTCRVCDAPPGVGLIRSRQLRNTQD